MDLANDTTTLDDKKAIASKVVGLLLKIVKQRD